MKTLNESVEAILAAIVAAVKAVVDEEGSDLDDVKDVVLGDRARPMPELPSVWVVPQPCRFRQAEFDDETWDMLVSIAGLVKSDDPERGAAAARRIAATARAAALGMTTEGAEVTDVRSESFDPTARSSERNRELFWTEAVVLVTFSVTG